MKIIIVTGGSLYINTETYDLEKDFTYVPFFEAYVENKIINEEYYQDDLIQDYISDNYDDDLIDDLTEEEEEKLFEELRAKMFGKLEK